jgi:single-strand DNA-binding protein
MSGYQYTIIVGNVGRSPELRYLPSGIAVADFSVAVSRRWNDRDTNEQREKTTWFKVTAWRGLAETVSQYVHTGQQVMVTGEVDVSAYLSADGDPRPSLDLTARDVQFLGSRGEQPVNPAEDMPF